MTAEGGPDAGSRRMLKRLPLSLVRGGGNLMAQLGWRRLLFALLFFALAPLGGWLYLSASPTPVSLNGATDRLVVSVYTEDPTAIVHLTIRVHPPVGNDYGQGKAVVQLDATTSKSTWAVILANQPTSDGTLKQQEILKPRGGGEARYLAVERLNPPGNAFGQPPREEFVLPASAILNDGDTLVASLPQVDDLTLGTAALSDGDALHAISEPDPYQFSEYCVNDEEFCNRNPQYVFWSPSGFTSEVRLEGIRKNLERSRIEILAPSSGALLGDDLVWQAANQLAPTLRAVDIASDQERTTKEFMSGIALATAAASLIALAQEKGERPPQPSPALPTVREDSSAPSNRAVAPAPTSLSAFTDAIQTLLFVVIIWLLNRPTQGCRAGKGAKRPTAALARQRRP